MPLATRHIRRNQTTRKCDEAPAAPTKGAIIVRAPGALADTQVAATTTPMAAAVMEVGTLMSATHIILVIPRWILRGSRTKVTMMMGTGRFTRSWKLLIDGGHVHPHPTASSNCFQLLIQNVHPHPTAKRIQYGNCPQSSTTTLFRAVWYCNSTIRAVWYH